MPVPPRVGDSVALTLQVPALTDGTPVLPLVLMPVPPYCAPIAVAFQVPAVTVPISVILLYDVVLLKAAFWMIPVPFRMVLAPTVSTLSQPLPTLKAVSVPDPPVMLETLIPLRLPALMP